MKTRKQTCELIWPHACKVEIMTRRAGRGNRPVLSHWPLQRDQSHSSHIHEMYKFWWNSILWRCRWLCWWSTPQLLSQHPLQNIPTYQVWKIKTNDLDLNLRVPTPHGTTNLSLDSRTGYNHNWFSASIPRPAKKHKKTDVRWQVVMERGR